MTWPERPGFRPATLPGVNPLEILAITGAGFVAGTVNTIVGSGSLVTFPTLLAFGYAPVLANVSNSVGLVAGGGSAIVGYRRELSGQRGRAIRLAVPAAIGGLTGGALLLALPASSFERIVPFLILGACVLVAFQPRLSRILAAHRPHGTEHLTLLPALVFCIGVYGGYFGAAQGVMMMATLSIFVADDLQRLNAVKNVLGTLINAVAAVLFILIAPVAWPAALLVAVGSVVGGQVGAVIGRRLPPAILRGAIVLVGTVVSLKLMAG